MQLSLLVAALAFHSSISVLGFSEDGTQALLREDSLSASGTYRTTLAVVDAAHDKPLFSVVVSERAPADAMFGVVELVDNSMCRDAIRALEPALAGFRALHAKLSGCAKPSRLSAVVDVDVPSPPLGPSPELERLADELGIRVGRTFVTENGPLVVVVLTDPDDIYGERDIVRIYERSDPRVIDRWPDPRSRLRQ